MLKSLFKEIRRGLSRSADASKGTSIDQGEQSDQTQRSAFAAASAATRTSLVADLRAQLTTSDGSASDWCRLGDWMLQLDQAAPAQQAFRRALQLQSLHARSHEGLGLALLRTGQLEEAFLRFETANKLAPQNTEVLVHWGLVDLALGKFAIAAGKFENAIERDPNNHHAWHNLGITSVKLGLLNQGLDQIRRAITIRPAFAAAHMNLALAYVKFGELNRALEAAQQATELAPQQSGAWLALAEVHRCLGDLPAARRAATQAKALGPTHPATSIELGLQDWLSGSTESAGQHFCDALQADPNSTEGQLALAEWHLAQGDWTRGWPLYESRRRAAPSPTRPVPYLEWQGEDLLGETLLVHAEQGLGDIILFASCLPDLMRRNARLVVEVPDRLSSLFQRSFPQLTVISFGGKQDLSPWSPEIEALRISKHIPIGSLPRLLRRRDDDFARTQPYLLADAAATGAWRDRLGGQGPVIGLAWRGGLPTTGSAMRSMRLSDLVTHIALQGARFVSLQYGPTETELAACTEQTGVQVHPGVGPQADLDEMAALTAACDGVATVCSTQAHLTGALGCRGVVMAPAGANWRYASRGDLSLWYPSLTVLRRGPLHDGWQDTVRAAGDRIREQIARP